jgi:phosphate transport system substrate-binding protein
MKTMTTTMQRLIIFMPMAFMPIALVLTAPGLSAQRQRPEPEPLYNAKVDPALPIYRSAASISGSLKGICSETFPDLMKLWVDGFRTHHPDVTIDVAPTGGGVGSKALAEGQIDFAAVTREISPADEEVFVKHYGYKPLEVAVVGGSYRSYGFTDALTFFVHKDNPIEHLSFTQIDAIYSKTRLRGGNEPIVTWGQVRQGAQGKMTAEWADKPIHAWGVEPWNGFEQFIRLRVLKGGQWRDGLSTEKLVIPLPDRVAADRYAISYSGIAYLKPDVAVKRIAVSENPDGPFLKGTFDEVAAQTYPLARVMYFYVNRPPGKPVDSRVREFLRFILSRDGQQAAVQDAIYTPLPLRLVNASLDRLR